MAPLPVRMKSLPEHVRVPASESAGERLTGFERLITHLATDFINVPSEDIDGAVRTALQKFGEFARLHRASIVLFDESRTVFAKTYEWCAEGVRPGAETVIGVPISQFGWVHEQIFANRVMMIGGPDDFPPEREDQEEVEKKRREERERRAVEDVDEEVPRDRRRGRHRRDDEREHERQRVEDDRERVGAAENDDQAEGDNF